MLPDFQAPELTQEQIDNLQQARTLIPKLREQLRRAKQAGIDVSQQETDLTNLEQQLNKLYNVYGRRTPNP